jgi:hypothetical protein
MEQAVACRVVGTQLDSDHKDICEPPLVHNYFTRMTIYSKIIRVAL